MMHNFFLISEDPHKIWFNEADIRKFFASAAVIKMVKKFFLLRKKIIFQVPKFSGSEIKIFFSNKIFLEKLKKILLRSTFFTFFYFLCLTLGRNEP